MAWAHDYLRAAIGGGPPPAEGYHWHRVLAALQAVEGDRTPESVALLRDVLRFAGPLTLHPDSDRPHSMAPDHLLHTTVMHILAEWDMETHRDVIEHVANTSRSANVVRIARTYLDETV